jgi:hypothetical protein
MELLCNIKERFWFILFRRYEPTVVILCNASYINQKMLEINATCTRAIANMKGLVYHRDFVRVGWGKLSCVLAVLIRL